MDAPIRECTLHIATGLQPLNSIEVIGELPKTPTPATGTPRKPMGSPDLNTALIYSGLPESTELCRANRVLRN